MTHQFKPGDPVLVIGGPRRGALTRVLSVLQVAEDWTDWFQMYGSEPGHEIDLPTQRQNGVVWAKPDWLLPLLDDSKRAEYLQDLNLDAPSEGVGRG